MLKVNFIRGLSAVVAGILLVSYQVSAEEQPSSSGAALEEIMVTATRREASLQEVPIAISVVDMGKIETLKPRTMQDFSGLAPNLHIGDMGATPGAAALFIRGQGYQALEKTQSPPVGVIIDGVFLAIANGSLMDAFDIEQIEISRGPQGIFFGKNTTAGVINVRRTRPTGELGGKFALSYGSNDAMSVKGLLNFPVGENGGLKIGATYNEEEGWNDNIFTGNKVGGKEYAALHVAFDYDFSDAVKLSLIYDNTDLDQEGTPVQYGNIATFEESNLAGALAPFTQLPTYNPVTGSPIGLGIRQVANDFEDKSALKSERISAELTFDTPIGELTSVTAYLDSEDFQNQDFDATCFGAPGCTNAVPNFAFATLHTIRPQFYEQFTQEIRLAGSAAGGRLDYLVGGYFAEEKSDFSQETLIGQPFTIKSASGQDADATSFFANLDYHITDNLTASIGARSIDESKDFYTEAYIDFTAFVVPQVPLLNDSADFDGTITRLAVDWQATDNTMLYFSRAEGYRSGGYSARGNLSERDPLASNCNSPTGCPGQNFLTYEPEDNVTYELGIKTTLCDDRMTLNAGIFSTQIEGLQTAQIVQTPNVGAGTNTYINNLPEAEIEGLEVEVAYRSASIDGLSFTANLGLTDGEITDGLLPESRLAIGPGGQAGSSNTLVDIFKGTTAGLQRIADYTYNVSATYERNLANGTLTFNANYNYIDDHGLSTGSDVVDFEEGYGLLGAYVGYSWNDNKYALSVSGRNLTSEDYRLSSLIAPAFNRWADDANYLLEFKAEY